MLPTPEFASGLPMVCECKPRVHYYTIKIDDFNLPVNSLCWSTVARGPSVFCGHSFIALKLSYAMDGIIGGPSGHFYLLPAKAIFSAVAL